MESSPWSRLIKFSKHSGEHNKLFLPTFMAILYNAKVKTDSLVAWKSTQMCVSDIYVHVFAVCV